MFYLCSSHCQAELAARAEDWAWSSARAHLAGVDDGLVAVRPLIERFGAAGLADLLGAGADDEAAFAALRGAETTGRPLGNADFIEGLERLLGRPIARRAPGRQPAQPPHDQPKLL